MTDIKKLYPIYIFISIIIGLVLFSNVGFAENINDGYLYDESDSYDRDGVRIIDFTVASTTVPAESPVESQIIIANYGTETVNDINLEPYITDKNGEINDNDYSLDPQSSYENIQLEPGQHKTYNFKFTFKEPDTEYNVSFIDSLPENRHIAKKNIDVKDENSGVSESLVLDRGRVNVDKIPITRYKDAYVSDRSNPGSSLSIPPVDRDENNNIVNADVAKGTISNFGNMRSDSETYGSINSTDGAIKAGFSAENIGTDEHYAISLIYELENIESAELNLVNSVGEQIDRNTSYYINNSSTGDISEREYQLSNKEIQHIQNQGELYFIYDNIDNTDDDFEIKIYEMNVNVLDNIWNLPEEELNTDLKITKQGSEVNTVEKGDYVYVEASIENVGNVSVVDKFRLHETEAISDSPTIDISNENIINPGDTQKIKYRTLIEKEDTYNFKVLDETKKLSVESEESETEVSNTSYEDSLMAMNYLNQLI